MFLFLHNHCSPFDSTVVLSKLFWGFRSVSHYRIFSRYYWQFCHYSAVNIYIHWMCVCKCILQFSFVSTRGPVRDNMRCFTDKLSMITVQGAWQWDVSPSHLVYMKSAKGVENCGVVTWWMVKSHSTGRIQYHWTTMVPAILANKMTVSKQWWSMFILLHFHWLGKGEKTLAL